MTFLKWQGSTVNFLRKGKWPAENHEPIYHSCCCFHVKNVTVSIGYTLCAFLLIAMVYFISLAQKADLTIWESRAIIAGTCLGTLIGVILTGLLLYGVIHDKPKLMLPYLITTSIVFVASLFGLACLAVAIVNGVDKRWEHWAEEHIWHQHMQGLAVAKVMLFILVGLQGWMLAVQWRCYLYFIRRKPKLNQMADMETGSDY